MLRVMRLKKNGRFIYFIKSGGQWYAMTTGTFLPQWFLDGLEVDFKLRF